MTHPYPAQTAQTTTTINNHKTQITTIAFSDRILVTITQSGRLPQWLTVPLANDNPTSADTLPLSNSSSEGFTPRTLLGGAGSGTREVLGQVMAREIAGGIVRRKGPGEGRVLVLGLGIDDVDGLVGDREGFWRVVEGVLKCLFN